MHVTIERAALLKSLQHVQSVVERRNTIPILSHLLINADGDNVSFTATDMDIAVVDAVGASVEQTGAITAPAHMMYDIVRKLPDGAQVALTTDGDAEQVRLKAGRSDFSLLGLPTADFPAIAEGELNHSFSIPVEDLRSLVDKTQFAISTEETRYYLNGIYLHVIETDEGLMLRAVATDGHRLARVEFPAPEGAADMPGVIVPRKTVTEMRKLVDDVSDPVTVSLSDTKIRFAVGSAVLTSKLIDGTFPDYQRVIPEGNDKTLTVHGKAFTEAVDRVSTIASDKSRAIKLSVDSGRVVLSATSPDQARASEEVPADYEAEALDIGFNSRYVLEMTRQIEGESVCFMISDGTSPTVVTDAADSRTLYVLMPMRV